MSAIVIAVDGTEKPLVPANGKTFTLKEMQDAIGGGYVEHLHLSDGRYLFVDEDGLMKQLPANPKATAMYGDGIVGPALVCDRTMVR